MSSHELAQLNLAKLRAPLDSPRLADFVASLEPINALAERSPGFVWRLATPAGDATSIRHFGDDVIVNMSVWSDVESLRRFVYRTRHAAVMRRRDEWFERFGATYLVLWWVPAGHRPSLAEAECRLERLSTLGASPAAFSFARIFAPPTGSGRESVS